MKASRSVTLGGMMSVTFVVGVMSSLVSSDGRNRQVGQTELCMAFCQLECMQADYSYPQCIGRCYDPNDFGSSIQPCTQQQCKQNPCSHFEYSADGASPPSVVRAAKTDPSQPVGKKILLTWKEELSAQNSQVVYSVQSKKWKNNPWEAEALVSEPSMELSYESCMFYRVAVINSDGSKGYSEPVTFAPEKPSSVSVGPQYFDQGWVLVEVQWQLRENSLGSNLRDIWGENSEFQVTVEQSDCDIVSPTISVVAKVATDKSKTLLKVMAPEQRKCFKYLVKVAVKLECNVYGEVASADLKVDRSKVCAASSIINNPDCPNTDTPVNQYPFDRSLDYDLLLDSEATPFYSGANQRFAVKVRWLFSAYTPNPREVPVTVSWQKLTNTKNFSVQAQTILGSFEHVIFVDPDSTYNIRVSQGNKVNPDNQAHSVYISHQLEIEYKKSLPTQVSSAIDDNNAISHANIQLMSLTPSILTLLIVMATFMIVLLIGLLSFVVKRKLIGPRHQVPRHRLMHCVGGNQTLRGGAGSGPGRDPCSMYYWWNEEQAALAAAASQENGIPGSGMYMDSWEVHLDDIYLYDVILQGSYGAVYKGAIPVQSNVVLPSPPSPPGYPTACSSPNHVSPTENKTILPAVVKMLADSVTGSDKVHFRKEIEILKRVGYHDHLLNLLACSTLSQPMCMVLEDAGLLQGDLLTYLRSFKPDESSAVSESDYGCSNYTSLLRSATPSHRSSPLWRNKTEQQQHQQLVPPTGDMLQMFAKQICVAMCHLASKGLFHRDLACRNILLTQDYSVKVGDYSMVRYAYSHEEYLSRVTGKLPLKWMAIEVIRDHVFTPRSDVWSYGVVLFELCTLGTVPYSNIPSNELLKTLQTGHRMEQPKNCSKQLYNVMMRCWREEPEERPDFGTILSTLTELTEGSSSSQCQHLIQLCQQQQHNHTSEEAMSSSCCSLAEQHHSEHPAVNNHMGSQNSTYQPASLPPPVPPKMPAVPANESSTLSSSEAGSMKRKMSSNITAIPTTEDRSKVKVVTSRPPPHPSSANSSFLLSQSQKSLERSTPVPSPLPCNENKDKPIENGHNSLKTFASKSRNEQPRRPSASGDSNACLTVAKPQINNCKEVAASDERCSNDSKLNPGGKSRQGAMQSFGHPALLPKK